MKEGRVQQQQARRTDLLKRGKIAGRWEGKVVCERYVKLKSDFTEVTQSLARAQRVVLF